MSLGRTPALALAISLSLALLLALPPLAIGASDRLPRWAPSIEAGLAQAKERNCALMVVLNMDDERGNQWMLDDVYTSDEFRAAAEKCVIAVASLGTHGTEKDPTTGKDVCSRFGTITCDQHKAIESVIRIDWLKRGPDDNVESPRHFFLSPTGKILLQRMWTIDAESLAKLMDRASALCTPDVLAKWDTTEGRLSRVTDESSVMRQEALRDLLAANDPKVDAAVLKLAKKSDVPGVVADIIGAFACDDAAPRRAVAHGFLKHKQSAVRIQAAYALQKSADARCLSPLTARISKERDEEVQAALCLALGACGKDDDGARDRLLKLAKKKKFSSRQHAIVALRPWIEDERVYKVLVKLPWSDDAPNEVKSAAIWVLGYSGHEELVPRLKALIEKNKMLEYITTRAVDKLNGGDPRRYDEAGGWLARHPIHAR